MHIIEESYLQTFSHSLAIADNSASSVTAILLSGSFAFRRSPVIIIKSGDFIAALEIRCLLSEPKMLLWRSVICIRQISSEIFFDCSIYVMLFRLYFDFITLFPVMHRSITTNMPTTLRSLYPFLHRFLILFLTILYFRSNHSQQILPLSSHSKKVDFFRIC